MDNNTRNPVDNAGQEKVENAQNIQNDVQSEDSKINNVPVTKEERRRQKKEARKAKKAAKKAKWRARPLWQKCLRIIVPIVIVVAVIAAVILIGFQPAAVSFLTGEIEKTVNATNEPEEVYNITPPDEEGAARVEAIPTYDEKDTWAVYVYMCGSNLESVGMNELSEVTQYMADAYADTYQAESSRRRQEQIFNFIEELDQHGLDLPRTMYVEKREPAEKKDEVAPSSGSNDTIGDSTHVLNEMTNVELPENVKMVIQTGGSNRWQSVLANPNRSNILLYDSDGMRQIEDNHIRNMGDPSTLADFMRYCQENYPADHQVLILLDHGGGPFGMCWDEVYGEDNLTLDEFTEAFTAVYGEHPEKKPFELIATHACLMSNLDAIKTFAPYGRYYAAGEEVLTDIKLGNPKYYLTEVFEQGTGTNGARIAMRAADNYVNLWGRMGNSLIVSQLLQTVTDYGVIDLDKADAVYAAYDELMERVFEEAVKDPSSMTSVAQAAGNSTRFANELANGYNLIDLGQFMDGLADEYPKETAKVKTALQDCVLYHRGTYDFKDLQGVSVYFPVQVTDMYGLKKYMNYMNDISKSDSTKAFYYYKVAGCLNDEYAAYAEEKGYGRARVVDTSALKKLQNEEITLFGDGNYGLKPELDEMDLVQSASFILGEYKADEEKILYYGDSAYVKMAEDGSLSTDFDCEWIAMDGHLLATELIDCAGGQTRYRSLVKINGVDYYLILGQDEASDEISLLGIAEANEKVAPDMTGRALLELKKGDTITPLYDSNRVGEKDDSNMITQEKGENFKFKGEDTKYTLEKLKDGSYLTAIEVQDLRGDKYTTGIVEITVKGGKVEEASVRRDMINDVYE